MVVMKLKSPSDLCERVKAYEDQHRGVSVMAWVIQSVHISTRYALHALPLKV